MGYEEHAPEAPEFWARVLGGAYLKTGIMGLKGLCEGLGVSDEAGVQRYRRMVDEKKSPKAATVKRVHLALGIPLEELMALIPPEDDYLAEANPTTGCYLHAKCA